MRAFLGLSLAAYAAAAPAFNTGTIHGDAAPILSSSTVEEIPNSYIIKFKSHVTESHAADHHSWVQSIHATSEDERLELRKRGFIPLADDVFRGLKHTYKIGDGFLGYSGHFDDEVIEQVRRHPDVSDSLAGPPSAHGRRPSFFVALYESCGRRLLRGFTSRTSGRRLDGGDT